MTRVLLAQILYQLLFVTKNSEKGILLNRDNFYFYFKGEVNLLFFEFFFNKLY